MRFRIPTIAGILLSLIIVGSIIVITESYLRTTTVASGDITPKQIEITNVSDTALTVSWTTTKAATGALSVKSKKGTSVAYDERDLTGKLSKYTTHSITVQNVSANEQITATILSDGKKHDPITIRTGPSVASQTTGLEPAYGTIVTPEKIPASGALIYLTLEGGQKLSTLAKQSGTWLIPLSLTRTEDLTSILPTTERMGESILVRFEGTETSAVSDTLNDAPVPEMVTGKTYDFRKLQAKTPIQSPLALRPAVSAPSSSQVLGESAPSPSVSGTVAISSPKQGAALTTTLPVIQGTGIAGNSVSIAIGITSIMSGTTTVGMDGIWRFTPSRHLPTGKQSVTITTKDKIGKPVAITHLFEILKSGTQVLGDATPSATPTIGTTIEPTPTIEIDETPTPTSTLAGDEVPTSGSAFPTIILLLLALGLISSGAVVVVKK